MKNKNKDGISVFEYAAIMTAVGVLVFACIACIGGIFMAGSQAAVKVFDLPSWAGWVIFGIFIVIWSLNGLGDRK